MIVFGVFTVIGLIEYFGLLQMAGTNKTVYIIIGLFLYILLAFIGLGMLDIVFGLLIFLIFPAVVGLQLLEKEINWTAVGSVFTAYFYVAVPFALLNTFFAFSYNEPFDGFLLIAVLVIIWCNDILAYLTGSFFGKHRLFERISPKKTWEGFAGGLIMALVAAFILSLFSSTLSVIEWLILALIIVLTATIGDLSESMLKRYAGVKDSGNLMPGHGGILDRFDAVLFATPFVFIYFKLLI